MRIRWMIGLAFLATALVVIPQLGCDEAADALKEAAGDDGVFCLDELLEMAGLSRSDLGDNADEVIAEVLSAQEDLLGTSYVIDCEAQDKNDELVGKGSGSSSGDAPEAEDGVNVTAPTAQDVPDRVQEIGDERGGDGEDVFILLDATGSMYDDQEEVAANIDTIVGDVENRNGRIGGAWYKDNYNCDDPWYAANASGLVDASSGLSEIRSFFQSVPVSGGCDWPESMYDALWETANQNWASTTKRMIIVISDAPPLDPPNSTHSESEVKSKLTELGITLHTITVGIGY